MPEKDSEERVLIQRAQRGDPDAVAALFRRYAPAIFWYFIFKDIHEYEQDLGQNRRGVKSGESFWRLQR